MYQALPLLKRIFARSTRPRLFSGELTPAIIDGPASAPRKPLEVLAVNVSGRSTIRATPMGGATAASAVDTSCQARGKPMYSAFAIARHFVATGVVALAAATLVAGAPLAYGAPCDGACNIAPGISPARPALPSGPSSSDPSNKGGSRGVQPTIPTVKPPPPPVIAAQTVVQKAPPPPPRVPPPAIPPDNLPRIPRNPVEPPPPDLVPVNVEPAPVPVAPAPVAPVPVVNPVGEPPSAPAAPISTTPVSRVLFTSSAEPGTQALTLIVLFMACGCWVYGNRIASQFSVRRKEHVAAGA